MKYRKAGITRGQGFGVTKEQEDKHREVAFFYVIGYGKWVKWEEMDPGELPFVNDYGNEAAKVFELLANNAVVQAVTALREGPWNLQDLYKLMTQLDQWAELTSEDRFNLGEMNEDILRTLHNHGLETFHLALLEKHKESAEATEALQATLEAIGLELLDTGAMYSANGEQEGPRDLVMGVPGTETEYVFKVWHAPRKAETDDTLPKNIAAAVRQWEVVA